MTLEEHHEAISAAIKAAEADNVYLDVCVDIDGSASIDLDQRGKNGRVVNYITTDWGQS